MRIPTEFTAIDKFSSIVSKMSGTVSKFANSTTASIDRVNKRINSTANTMAIGGAAIAAPLAFAVNKAIDFEDKMADVGKTTGLSGKDLEDYGKSILGMSKSTRTGIDDLIKIGEIGGQLGIASKDLISFTEASNQFAVALGSDYGGTEQAISQVGKINSLFADTRGLTAAASITKVGSAINQLGAVGAGTSANINDFILRMGALPDAIKPSLTKTAALGTFFEESGIDAQIASGGLSNFLLVAGQGITGFAAQMGVSANAAKKMLANDPTEFAVKFSKSLKGMKPDVLANTLKNLKLGSQETIKVLGALGSGSERLGSLIDVSNDAFTKGTSLMNEYNSKNETRAAKLAKAKNAIEAFTITIGTQLLPILGKVIEKVSPILDGLFNWANANPAVTKTVLGIAAALLGFSLVLKGVSMAMTVSKFAIIGYNAAMAAYEVVALTAAFTGASFAAVIWATLAPILAVIAVIALIVAAFYYWDEIVQWFSEQWATFTNFLSEFDFVGLFMGIGQSIIDFMLMPLTSVLKLVAMIPGGIGKAAQTGLDKINEMTDLKMLVGHDVKKLDSPEQTNAKLMQENRASGGIDINVRDKGNNVESVNPFGNSGIPIKLGSTQGAF